MEQRGTEVNEAPTVNMKGMQIKQGLTNMDFYQKTKLEKKLQENSICTF